MKSFFRRLFGKLKRTKPEEPPRAKQPSTEPKPKRRTDSSFEPLEGRIAPALLLNASTIQFTDIDGDLVTIKFSKALFKPSDDLNLHLATVFRFLDSNDSVKTAADNGSATDVAQLALLDLTTLSTVGTPNPAAGCSITITATQQNGGDGFVNVGYIKASASSVVGNVLKSVVVDGDLGRIDVGDTAHRTGLGSLTVQSLGAMGLTTQLAAGASLTSIIGGAVGKFWVKGDVVDALVKVQGGSSFTKVFGTIGSLIIDGSLRVSAANVAVDAGQFNVDDNIGSIKIGKTSAHGIFGGTGASSALIKVAGKIGNVVISGSIHGGAGKDSGEISAAGGIGNVTLGNELWSGSGENSGRITTNGSIGAIKLQRINAFDPDGGAGTLDPGKNSGTISALGNITSLTLAEGIKGGKLEGSGLVRAVGSIGKLSIGASLEGGDGKDSARVSAGAIGSVVIGGKLSGGLGSSSGSITVTGNVGSITLKNSILAPAVLVAGKGATSGTISVGGNIGPMKVLGLVDGSTTDAGLNAGSIQAGGSIASLTLASGLKGGAAEGTGAVIVGSNLSSLKVTGSLLGGGGLNSGSVIAGGRIASAVIAGNLEGGAGDNSGALVTGLDTAINGDLTKATISGVVKGGAGIGSGSVRVGGKLGTVTIGAPGGVASVLQGGSGGGSGSIFVENGVGSLTLNGSVDGGTQLNSGSLILAGSVNKVKVVGALNGNTGDGSGSIQVRDIDLVTSYRSGNIASLLVTGAIHGNVGIGSGQVLVEGTAKTIVVGAVTGGSGVDSGRIAVGMGMAALVDEYMTIGGAASITIKGALASSSGMGSGVVEVGAKLGALTIEGALTNSAIHVGRDLAKLTVNGDVTGTTISAQGQAKPTAKIDLAIGTVTLKASVTDTDILAGYDRFGNPVNGSAQIGTVKVTSNWTASSIAAGMEDMGADGFGDDDDIAIASGLGPVSKIASIIIGGQVTGTAAPDDHFGFTARQVVSVKIGGVLQALTTGTETLPLAGNPATNDLSIREVA